MINFLNISPETHPHTHPHIHIHTHIYIYIYLRYGVKEKKDKNEKHIRKLIRKNPKIEVQINSRLKGTAMHVI